MDREFPQAVLITIDKYGSGNKPIIDGNGYQASIFIENKQYIEVKNMELKNDASHLKPNGNVRLMSGSSRSGNEERYGLLFLISSSGSNYKTIKISDLKVHEVYSSTAVSADGSTRYEGRGVAFESLSGINNYFEEDISNLEVRNTSWIGLHFRNQLSSDNANYYHRNITVKNSHFEDTGGSGIVFARTKDVLVQGSILKGQVLIMIQGCGTEEVGSGCFHQMMLLYKKILLKMLTDLKILLELILTGAMREW